MGKRKSVNISAEIRDRLATISGSSGLSTGRLVDALLEDGLERLERAGGITVQTDGSVRIGGALPPPPFQATPRQPVADGRAEPGSPERKEEILKGGTREVRM